MNSFQDSDRKIGVGVIGASPANPGWAVAAHIPAIQALPDFELAAVSTSRAETARMAGEAFGVPAFDHHAGLIAHPGVDLVVVAVKVPDHRRLIDDALAAGKMVFSEWPLGRSLSEASKLAARAKGAGVRTFIGLQGRYAPAVQHAKTLIASGAIGDVLATTLVGSGIAWGGITDRAHAYMFDAGNGATTLSVPTMHALDALSFVLGEIESVSAATAVRRPHVRVIDDGSMLNVNAADQVAIAARLNSGAIASIFFRGGVSRGQNLHWEINGSEGDIVFTSAIGNLQVADLMLSMGTGDQAGVQAVSLPEHYARAPGGLSGELGANVLRAYSAIARDLRAGTHEAPDFSHAVNRHRLIDAIEASSATSQVVRTIP